MLLTEHGFYLSGQVSVVCALSPPAGDEKAADKMFSGDGSPLFP